MFIINWSVKCIIWSELLGIIQFPRWRLLLYLQQYTHTMLCTALACYWWNLFIPLKLLWLQANLCACSCSHTYRHKKTDKRNRTWLSVSVYVNSEIYKPFYYAAIKLFINLVSVLCSTRSPFKSYLNWLKFSKKKEQTTMHYCVVVIIIMGAG